MLNIDHATLNAIRDFTSLPQMVIEQGAKHARLVNIETGDFIPLAGSASDYRSARNAKAAARRLAMTGCGLIFARTGKKPVGNTFSAYNPNQRRDFR